MANKPPTMSDERWSSLDPLMQYDVDISYHLEMIEAFSQFIENHVNDLLAVPKWPTKAEERIQIAQRMLILALDRVTKAKHAMEKKPHVA